jgi:hypothetical protein
MKSMMTIADTLYLYTGLSSLISCFLCNFGTLAKLRALTRSSFNVSLFLAAFGNHDAQQIHHARLLIANFHHLRRSVFFGSQQLALYLVILKHPKLTLLRIATDYISLSGNTALPYRQKRMVEEVVHA